jgi:DNA-binding response OmpR family regulator
MADAWIYTTDREGAKEFGLPLAELGFSPRFIADGELVPSRDGAGAGRPALALIVAPSAPDLIARIRADDELRDVPLLLATNADDLGGDTSEADELLVWPFTRNELEARVARARKQAHGVEEDEVVRCGALELNLRTYQVAVDGRAVSFTYMEYELLKFLITHPNRVFSREALLARVWGYDYYGGARTVDVHIRRVRAKLGQSHAWRVQTVRSVGYLFDTKAAARQ